MRNKSKLIGGVMLALVVVGALSMPVTAVVRDRVIPVPPKINETCIILCDHFLDGNNKVVGGWGATIEETKTYYSNVSNTATILEGYFEHLHSITEKSCSVEFIILFQEQIPIGPKMVRTEQEKLYEKKIKCDELNNIYPFSIDVSKYRGKKIWQIIILNEDDTCSTDTKQLAFDLIDATESRISELKREDVETAEIEELVKRAKEKYDAGDYVDAAKMATDAKSRADLAYHNKKSFRVECNPWPPLLPLTTTPHATPSPTPSPIPTPSPTSTPIEQTPTPLPSHSPTPTPLPPTPPPDDGYNSWVFLVIAVVGGIVVLFSIKPIMIAYYTMKMNKWEREGYDVSKLKEVLKR